MKFLKLLSLALLFTLIFPNSLSATGVIYDSDGDTHYPQKILILIVERVDSMDYYFAEEFESVKDGSILLYSTNLIDSQTSSTEASTIRNVEKISRPTKNLAEKIKSLPNGFDETILEYLKKDDPAEFMTNSNIVNQISFANLEELENSEIDFNNSNLETEIKSLLESGDSVTVFYLTPNNYTSFVQPFLTTGSSKFGYADLQMSSLVNFDKEIEIEVFIISDAKKISTETGSSGTSEEFGLDISWASEVEISSLKISNPETILKTANETVWITRFEGEISNNWGSSLAFFNHSDQDESGQGKMESSDWVLLPKDVIYYGFVKNIYGQFLIFSLLIFFQSRASRVFWKVIFWTLQLPFIIFVAVFSSKNIIDLLLVESDGSFENRLFNATPYIFFFLLLLFVILFQILRQYVNSENKDDFSIEVVEPASDKVKPIENEESINQDANFDESEKIMLEVETELALPKAKKVRRAPKKNAIKKRGSAKKKSPKKKVAVKQIKAKKDE